MSEWDPDYVRDVRIQQLKKIVEDFGHLWDLNLPAWNDIPGSAGDPAFMILKQMAIMRSRKLVIIENGKITTEI